jgi:hypothetical protein
MNTPRLLLVLAAATFSTPGSARAELRFAQTDVRVKAAADDRVLTATFPFQNVGTEPVFVTSVTTSCTCTTAQTDKIHLAPNESGVITATYKIGANEGAQKQTITVLTNEKEAAAYTLSIGADVPKHALAELPRVIPVTPALLFWSKKPFATKTVKVDLTGITGARVSASCSNEAFKISTRESPDKQLVFLDVTPDESASDTRGELHISVANHSYKPTNIVVALTVLAPK